MKGRKPGDLLEPRRLHIGWEVGTDPTWAPYPDVGGKLGMIPINQVPITQDLRERLVEWAQIVERAFFDAGQRIDSASPEIKRLDQIGLQLWADVVTQLGDSYELHYDSLIAGESFRIHNRPPRENV